MKRRQIALFISDLARLTSQMKTLLGSIKRPLTQSWFWNLVELIISPGRSQGIGKEAVTVGGGCSGRGNGSGSEHCREAVALLQP